MDTERVEQLRRAAYSRNATEADWHALGAALAVELEDQAEERPGVVAVETQEPQSTATVAKAPASTKAPTRRRFRLPLVLFFAGLVVGAVAGGLVGTAVARENARDVSLFSVLSERESVATPAGVSLSGTSSWDLGEVDGVQLIASQGVGENDSDTVCLTLARMDGSSSGSCTSRDDFIRHGIGTTANSNWDFASYFWSLSQPPGKVVCSHADWPSC